SEGADGWRTDCAEGRCRGRTRGQENGAADSSDERRRRRRRTLRAGRSGPGGRHAGRADMSVPGRVTVVEVGPRDGLQNERAHVATADKVEFVNRLSAANLPVIEDRKSTRLNSSHEWIS